METGICFVSQGIQRTFTTWWNGFRLREQIQPCWMGEFRVDPVLPLDPYFSSSSANSLLVNTVQIHKTFTTGEHEFAGAWGVLTYSNIVNINLLYSLTHSDFTYFASSSLAMRRRMWLVAEAALSMSTALWSKVSRLNCPLSRPQPKIWAARLGEATSRWWLRPDCHRWPPRSGPLAADFLSRTNKDLKTRTSEIQMQERGNVLFSFRRFVRLWQ